MQQNESKIIYCEPNPLNFYGRSSHGLDLNSVKMLQKRQHRLE